MKLVNTFTTQTQYFLLTALLSSQNALVDFSLSESSHIDGNKVSRCHNKSPSTSCYRDGAGTLKAPCCPPHATRGHLGRDLTVIDAHV